MSEHNFLRLESDPLGEFLRNLMQLQQDESETPEEPEELADSVFGTSEDSNNRPVGLVRTLSSPSTVLLLEAETERSGNSCWQPNEPLNPNQFSLPDYCTLSEWPSQRAEEEKEEKEEERSISSADVQTTTQEGKGTGDPFSTRSVKPADSANDLPRIQQQQRKRRYQRRGAVRIRNWSLQQRPPSHSISRSAEDFGLDQLTPEESNVKQFNPADFMIASRNSHGVTRKLSMRQKANIPSLLIDEHSSLSGDETLPKTIKTLRETRSGSLPSMSLHSNDSSNSQTWSSTSGDKDSTEHIFNGPMMTSIFRADSTNDSVSDFQAFIKDEVDGNKAELQSPISPMPDCPPHSAPPFVDDPLQFNFERRRSVIQELPAITEDQREEERPPSQVSTHENDNPLHKRSTSDYVLDKKERSPQLEKRNSIQEPKDQPRLRVIGGNPNLSNDLHDFDGYNSFKLNKNPLEMPFAHRDGKCLILKPDGSKKYQMVEAQKSDFVATEMDSVMSTPRRITIQKKKAKAKRRQSSMCISNAVDFINPTLIYDANNAEAIYPALSIIPEKGAIQKQLSASTISRVERDKKPGLILSSLLSIRHKKKKEGRSSASISPSGSDFDTKRFSSSDLNNSFGSSRKSSEVLPDSLARVFGSHGGGYDWRNDTEEREEVQTPWPMWEKAKWEDLRIWDEMESSWSDKNQGNKLGSREVKRQNLIYEFYATEKRHCRVLIFLQQVFQAGLLRGSVLKPEDVKKLIPDVLDSLLDFHLNLLRQIQERINKSSIVNTILDIVVNEFKTGDQRAAAVNAYTEFCVASHDTDNFYAECIKSGTFRAFIQHVATLNIPDNKFNKSLDFKSCFLLIKQRISKYPVLIEQMKKYEVEAEQVYSEKALLAVKTFAQRVDREMSGHELTRRLEQVKSMIDRNSVGKVLEQRFTYDDLFLSGPEFRKILSIGTVKICSVNKEPIEVCIILFDDIIVFFHNRNGPLYFFSNKNQMQASVLPLKSTIVREIPRSSTEVMLVVVDAQKPDLYPLNFNTKAEMVQWVSAIKAAQKSAPNFVRLANNRKLFVEGKGPNSSTEHDISAEEASFTEKIDQWHNGLDALFAGQKEHELKLKEYMERRLEFMDSVRSYLSLYPSRITLDPSVTGTTSVRQREFKEMTRVRKVIKSHFADLKATRRIGLDKLVELAEKSRDSDLPAYFDEVYELMHPVDADSATFSSSSDENLPSTSDRCRKPRRVRTYHGAEDTPQTSAGVARRNTTVPSVKHSNSDCFNQLIEEELKKLPLKSSAKSRRATTELIREMVRLRIDNDRLRNDNAMNTLHVAALKARKPPFQETTEKLESLRQKQEEVQKHEEDFKRDYNFRIDQLRIFEDELKQKEQVLNDREASFHNNNTSHSESNLSRETSFRHGAVIMDKQMNILTRSTTSDIDVVPRHLASKSETKPVAKPGRRYK